VADAVAIEPVSAFSFPANREINREFGDFAPNSIPDASVLVIITPTWSKIP